MGMEERKVSVLVFASRAVIAFCSLMFIHIQNSKNRMKH